jgi:hypothetical protein
MVVAGATVVVARTEELESRMISFLLLRLLSNNCGAQLVGEMLLNIRTVLMAAQVETGETGEMLAWEGTAHLVE